MEFHHYHLLPIFAFLTLALGVSSHASSSSEEYWKTVLPNTPMPKTIEDLIKSEDTTGVHVGNHGVDVNVGKPGKGGTSVNVGPKGHPFLYRYGATETQLHEDQNIAKFFQEKDIKPGTQMNLHFTKTTNEAPLLPRKVSESIPFSSEKMPEILSQFDIESNSKEAKVMGDTIKECEAKGIKGEEKYCATSLESMVDYATSKLGKNVNAISTYVGKEKDAQKYVFTGVKKVLGTKAMVCHKMEYASAIFYCHKTKTTKTYVVSLVAVDGTKVKAVVICHTDTSQWNPKHLAFHVLKVKPGTVPICHFLPEDHIVWVPK